MFKKNSKYEVENFERIFAKPEEGLDENQVKSQVEKGLVNITSHDSYKSFGRIIFDNVFTYFNLIFIVLGFLLVLVGAYKDMAFLFVVFFNILIGIVQQIRSKVKIDKLNIISSPRSTVMRSGEKVKILNSEVVRDDIIFFKTGEQINVDAKILNGSVQVDESLLTGEADPIYKKENENLLSGSFVLSGSCVARVENVGNSCYANKLVFEAKKDVEKNKSYMMNAINTIIKIISFAIIPFGVILFLKQIFLLKMDFNISIKTVVAALVGMIPEGLYLLTSVSLVVSILKLVKANVLVHEMSAVETLARVDLICIDKTGTITEPEMKVVDIVRLHVTAEQISVEEVINAVVDNMPDDNITAKALKKRFYKSSSWEVDKIHPFLSSTKWFGVEFEKHGKFLIGAPEFILKEQYIKIKYKVEEGLNDGKRVILLAKLDGEIKNSEIVGDLQPLALILLENPIRKSIFKVFSFFNSQGVKIKVISGDNPDFVFNVCKKAKIENISGCVDASKLKTYEDLEKAVEENDVFGRVTPAQKRDIVRLLKKYKKHTVAFVGDGVNDVLALRNSDVGIAMLSGSEAAAQACEIVLLNSDFEFMPKIVLEGRRVINNIERFAALFLTKNIFSFSFAFLALIFKLRFPITPYQFTFISSITIGLPSFLLTMEPTTSIVRGSFVKNVFKKAIPCGLCNIFITLLVQILFNIFKINSAEMSHVSAAILGISGIFILLEVCRPLNFLKRIIVLAMSFLMAISIFFAKGFANFFTLSLNSVLILIFTSVLIWPILKFLILIFNNIIKNKSCNK